MRNDDIYLGLYRSQDYENAQEAMDNGALYVSASDITGAYTALEDCLAGVNAAEDCTGVMIRAVVVDGRVPSKYVEIKGDMDIKMFREGEFWDVHKKHVKYFTVANEESRA